MLILSPTNVGEKLWNVGRPTFHHLRHFNFFQLQTRRGAASLIEKALPLQWRGGASSSRGGASGLSRPKGLALMGLAHQTKRA